YLGFQLYSWLGSVLGFLIPPLLAFIVSQLFFNKQEVVTKEQLALEIRKLIGDRVARDSKIVESIVNSPHSLFMAHVYIYLEIAGTAVRERYGIIGDLRIGGNLEDSLLADFTASAKNEKER